VEFAPLNILLYSWSNLVSSLLCLQEFARKLIELYGVAVIPGSFCGYPGWLRVCYSNLPPDQCRVAAVRLKNGLIELCKS